MKNIILIPLLFLITSATFYYMFSFDKVYDSSLKYITKNYEKVDKELKYSYTPYKKFEKQNLYGWDATHYNRIKNIGYDLNSDPANEYILAFFPLFPYAWGLVDFSTFGVLILNLMFFIIGIYFLLKTVNPFLLNRQYEIALICCLPLNVVFFIPYTEALFFATSSMGLYGLIKRNDLLYFTGMFLASMTRSAAVIVIIAMVLTELYFLLGSGFKRVKVTRFLKNITPLIMGTLLVAIIQNIQSGKGLLGFYHAQSLWGWKLSWPEFIEDWSLEQYSMNISILMFLLPIALYFPLRKLIEKKVKDTPTSYTLILSSIYLIGISLYCFLYHKGSLNGIFRYTACTSFFIYWILYMLKRYQGKKDQVLAHSVLILLTVLALFLSTNCSFSPYWGVDGLTGNYGSEWKFLDSGFYIIAAITISILFKVYSYHKTALWILIISLIYNALWTSYLFNVFSVEGPLFT